MRIEGTLQSIYERSPKASTFVKSAITMTVATVALESLCSINGAEAGPVTYALCIAACAFSAPPILPFCLAACAPSLGPWCP